MLKRWLSLVLAMVLLFTAAVPAVLAEETFEAHVQALLDALLKDLESQLPQTEYKETPTPTSASVNAVSIEKDTVTLKDGESITENISSADAEFYRYSFKTPAPVDDPIATVELSATPRTSVNSNWVSGSTGLYLDYTVHAHKPGSVILNFSYTLEIDEQGTGSYFPVLERTYTLPVEVIPALNQPKVEVRLVPGNTTKLVTGYPEWVDALDDALGLWGVGDLIDLVMAFTGVGAAAEVARDRIISWLIFDQLHAIRKPDVSPDIQLDVSVYNPNDVSLKYQVTLSSAADFSNSTTFASGGVDTYAEYMQPAATAGTGPLSTSAYASLSLAPGWTRIHHFKLKPHMLYGGGEYTVPFTMLIPWSENDPDVAFGSRGGIQEDFDIHVVSELDEEHTYQGKEVYKDLITRVKNAIEFIMKYNPVKISIQQQLPVPL